MTLPVILASQSPRRKSLLEQAEITFTIKTAHSDEHFPDDLDPALVPEHIASNKAIAVQQALQQEGSGQDALIIAADTVVILDNEIIGKPEDAEDAKKILGKLSGQKHKVVTGVVLLSQQGRRAFSDTTYVHFRPLTPSQISHYVDRYQPLDKAGAYAIQEWIGLVGIEKIDGDFYNVMGLPVNRLLREIEAMK